MTEQSKFLGWFQAQHGQRASGVMAGFSEDRLRDEIARGKIAEAELESRALWDAKQQAALYAWKASRLIEQPESV